MPRSIPFLPFLSLALLTACAAPAPAPPDYGARIQTANDILLNQGDVARIPEFFAPAYVGHSTGGDYGGEVIAEMVTALRSAMPDLHVEIEILATEGNRVAWLRTHRGTQQGDFMGVPGSGRTIVWQEMVVTRYEGDLIAEEWGVSDFVERLQVP